MRKEFLVEGRSVQLEAEGNRFRYRSDGGASVSSDFSVQALEPGFFSVRIGGRNYRVALGAAGEVFVNGRRIRMELFDPRDLRSSSGGASAHGRQQISALMPGKVIRVLVAPGDKVEAGQGLIVVEAMKMQNEMKSPKAGTVVEVRVKADATVAAGDALAVIE